MAGEGIGGLISGLSGAMPVSEADVRTRLVGPLLGLLGYPGANRAEEFPIFANEGRKPLPSKPADVVLFDSPDHASHRSREDRGWVAEHALAVVEIKRPSESLDEARGQAQFYSHRKRVPFYALTNGEELAVYRMQGLFDDEEALRCPVAEILRPAQAQRAALPHRGGPGQGDHEGHKAPARLSPGGRRPAYRGRPQARARRHPRGRPRGGPKRTRALRAVAIRDRALLLLGFAASLRRSEISALLVSDLVFVEGEGVIAEVRTSKTDRTGEGEGVGIPYGERAETCPVTHLCRWIALSGRRGDSPLFCRVDRHGNLGEGGLSGWGINDLVQRRVQSVGLDATRLSGYSMRFGLPTSASAQKVGMEAWMPHTRHKSVKVAMRYARRGTLFTNNSAAQVGL